MIYRIVLLLALASFSVPAVAGPLGAEMGMNPSDIPNIASTDTPGWYTSNTAPSPSTLFESYSYRFGNEGLCEIRAFGYISLKDSGLERQTNDVIRALENKYGEKDERTVFPSTYADEFKNDLMSGIRGNDKWYFIDWRSKGYQRLPNSLMSINLNTQGRSIAKASIALHYLFDNYPSCKPNSKTDNL